MNERLMLKYRAFCFDKEKMYFSAIDFNGLFCIDTNNNKLEYIKSFRDVELGETYIHIAPMIKYHDELVCFPNKNNHISFINIGTKEEKTVPLDEYGKRTGIVGIAIWDNRAYLFSLHGFILVFDLDKKRVISCIQVDYPFQEDVFYRHIYQEKQTAWVTIMNSNTLLKIDLAEGNYELVNLPDDGVNISGVIADGDALYITQMDSASIIEWDRNTNVLKKYEIENNYKIRYRTICPFAEMCFLKEKGFIIIPGLDIAGIFLFDINSKKCRRITEFPMGFQFQDTKEYHPFFARAYYENNKVWIPQERGNMMLKYDIESEEWKGIEVSIDKQQIYEAENRIREVFSQTEIKHERPIYFSLEDFIKLIQNG